MDGIVDITEDDPIRVLVLPSGSVLLGTSFAAFRFRTIAAFDACMEQVDRERAAHGYEALDQYHERFQALRAERAS